MTTDVRPDWTRLGCQSFEGEAYLLPNGNVYKTYYRTSGQQEADALKALASYDIAPKHLASLPSVVIMSYIKGVTLAELWFYLKEQRSSLHHVLDELARTVATLHAAGWVHQDLHTANIMLLPNGSVKLIDFNKAFACSSEEKRCKDLELFDACTGMEDEDFQYFINQYSSYLNN